MKIEDFNNKNTFSIPEGYFETLQNKIVSRTSNSNVPTTAKRKKYIGWRNLGYAASIAAAAIWGVFAYNNSESNYNIVANEEYYDNEYIDNMLNNYPIDDYTFYCYLTNTNMD